MTFSYSAGTTTPTLAGLVEFNGIRINDGTFKSEHLGGLIDMPDVRGGVVPMQADHGGIDTLPLYAPRDISLDGWLLTAVYDDVYAGMDYLRGKFTLDVGSQTLVCQQRGWSTRRQVTARVAGRVQFIEPDVTRKKIGRRDFTIPMIAPDPLMYDADNLKTATMTIGGSSITVTNNGSAPAPFIARLTGPWTTSMTLTCSTSGKTLVYGNGVVAGAYVDVDTHRGAHTFTSNTGANQYFNRGTWTLFTIPVGTSTWQATATAGTSGASQVTLTWRDAWW